MDEIKNIEFKEYFLNNKRHLDKLPSDIRHLIYTKAKVKPFHKSALKLREIMIKQISPMEKLFLLEDLKT